MKKYNEMSDIEIQNNINSMKMKYDSIKNEINKLLNELDIIDNEYIKINKELENRKNNE